MFLQRRKTNPRVVDGRVRRKHRDRSGADYRPTSQFRIDRVRPRPGYRHFVTASDVMAFVHLLPDWPELTIGLQRILLDRNPFSQGWYTPGTVALCNWPERAMDFFGGEFFHQHAATFARLGVPCHPCLLYRLEEVRTESLNWLRENRRETLVDIDDPEALDRAELNPDGVEANELYEDEVSDYLGAKRGPSHYRVAPVWRAEFTPETVHAFQLIHILVHKLGPHRDEMTYPNRRPGGARTEAFAETYALRHEAAIWQSYKRVFRRS
jgi:hypothetical protein